eukprot:4510601-Prymnesium_polylepis.1
MWARRRTTAWWRSPSPWRAPRIHRMAMRCTQASSSWCSTARAGSSSLTRTPATARRTRRHTSR